MKIIVEVDTRNPQSAEEIRREAQYLLYVAANLDTFLAGAAAAGASVPSTQVIAEQAPAPAAQVPPPPPAVAADSAPAAQVPPPPPAGAAAPSAPQFDKTGLPWDERIHSSKKTINADGTWKQRRGVTPPVVAAVEAELRGGQASGVVGGPATPAAQVPPPPPAAAADVPPPPPAVPEVPAAPAATPAAPPSPLSLLQRLAGAVSAGKVSFEDVLKEAQKYGCADLGAVAADAGISAMIEQTFVMRGVI